MLCKNLAYLVQQHACFTVVLVMSNGNKPVKTTDALRRRLPTAPKLPTPETAEPGFEPGTFCIEVRDFNHYTTAAWHHPRIKVIVLWVANVILSFVLTLHSSQASVC